MWHDGSAQHPGGQKYRFRVGQVRDYHAFTQLCKVGLGKDQFNDISHGDKQQQAADHFFQRFLSTPLEHQDQKGGDPGQHRPLQ